MQQTPKDQTFPEPETRAGLNPSTVAGSHTFSPEDLRNHLHDLNVQERSLSGQELRDSEARYRRLFEAAHDGILIVDEPTGLILDVNPFMVRLLGYSREEYVGKALWDIGVFRNSRMSKIAFQDLEQKQYIRYEDLPLETKSGQIINVEFVSNVYIVAGGKVIECSIRDISQHKFAELSQKRLQQTQKMETVGQLAGGIAHDFNNLLGVIIGYCEILEEQSGLPETTCKMIREIHSAGSLAATLTQRLLAFSRKQVLQPAFMDLNATVTRATALLERLIGDDVQLVSTLAGDLGTIKADPVQIKQVIMNLVINSRDAMPHGGRITIVTANLDVDEAFAGLHPLTRVGPYVMLTVSDTGIGMDQETQSHIFEPFFSTKATGKGTGLGLATVFGIVRQSFGEIDVYSERGIGTTFKIYFPRCNEAVAVVQPVKAALVGRGTETILLVDDSAPLRGLTRRLLEDSGYTVLDASNAVQALRLVADHKGTLPLMITDVVMPGLSGPDLAEQLTVLRLDMRVLFTSGYADDELAQRGMLGTTYSFLEKPFTRDALMVKVRELLDAPAPLADSRYH